MLRCCGLNHFNHERRSSASHVIACTDARVNAVDQTQPHMVSGHKAATLRKDGQQCRLAKVGALATHIWARDEQQGRRSAIIACTQAKCVRHKSSATLLFQSAFHHRMAASNELQNAALIDLWPHPSTHGSDVRKASEQIDLCDPACGFADAGGIAKQTPPQLTEDATLNLQ
jgi:hypothetical protein